jgi:biotin carboxylase
MSIAIVDGFSTGRELAPFLRARGVDCVHVQSTPRLPDYFARAVDGSAYVGAVVHDGDLEATRAAVARWRPTAVVVGSELGVSLADALAEALGLPGNGTALSRARRDKHAMGEAVARAGLRTAAQAHGSDPDELARWAQGRGAWPVVVKPVDSAGTDGVAFCASPAEVRRAARELMGRANRMGSTNRELLVQERLEGQQFFLNSVSWEGVHHVSEIWRETKLTVPGASVVSDREDLLPATGPDQDVLVPYVTAVLDALGVAYGAAHTEVMLTAEGPVLIECGARLQGMLVSGAVRRATGADHVTVTVEAYLDPGSVRRRAATPYVLREHVTGVWLIAREAGVVTGGRGMAQVRRLPSYFDAIESVGVGGVVPRTVDLFSAPGLIYLVHEDADQIEADYERIRALERGGRFFALQAR